MKFKQYLNENFYIEIPEDVIDPVYESTVSGQVAVEFEVPKRNREKYKKLNKKTNRIKTFRKIKYYKTTIKPEDRSFENQPRYADKKPICTFQQWLCIDSKKRQSSHNRVSYGKAANGKWYGWSHRAIASFGIGDSITSDSMVKDIKRKIPYKIRNEKDAEWHSIKFASAVS